MDGASPKKQVLRRSPLDIQMNIIEAARETIVPTVLMYKCNLNWRSLHTQLGICLACKFVSVSKYSGKNGRPKYIIQATPKGLEALNFYYQLNSKALPRL